MPPSRGQRTEASIKKKRATVVSMGCIFLFITRMRPGLVVAGLV